MQLDLAALVVVVAWWRRTEAPGGMSPPASARPRGELTCIRPRAHAEIFWYPLAPWT